MRILRITALLAAIYVFFYLLPDFAPERPAAFLREATGDTSPELCDFSSLGFTQVNQRRSPINMRLQPDSPPRAGEEVRVTVALNRTGGRAVTFEDLEEKHTEKFHLLIVDPSLQDYQHHHPVPAQRAAGEYEFSFTPRHGGEYRFFAEVVPTATGRPVQATADLVIAGADASPGAGAGLEATVDDYAFVMAPPIDGIRAGKPSIVSLEVLNVSDGEPVPLEPVMGAWAHLVAFDPDRSGFAHMHPLQEDLDLPLHESEPVIDFMFYAEEAGVYTIWSQVKIDGEEIYAPFEIDVR